MQKHPRALWTCHDCGVRYPYSCEYPERTEKIKIIYNFSDGVRGAPPFSKPYNDSEIIGTINFCLKCKIAEKMGVKRNEKC